MALPEAGPASGAGIRISGGERVSHLEGSTDWLKRDYLFEVKEDCREVELVVELRSTSGKLFIQRDLFACRSFDKQVQFHDRLAPTQRVSRKGAKLAKDGRTTFAHSAPWRDLPIEER